MAVKHASHLFRVPASITFFEGYPVGTCQRTNFFLCMSLGTEKVSIAHLIISPYSLGCTC